jgi:hypothetical protein
MVVFPPVLLLELLLPVTVPWESVLFTAAVLFCTVVPLLLLTTVPLLFELSPLPVLFTVVPLDPGSPTVVPPVAVLVFAAVAIPAVFVASPVEMVVDPELLPSFCPPV